MKDYPLISDYIEAIKAAEDNFEQLKHLRPVLGVDGNPVISSGNFAVVFKMKDENTGKFYAVKCFLKEQEGREDAYRLISEELNSVNSPYLTPIKYLDKELFVDSRNTDDTEFPVLLMDWVEGTPLDKYIQVYVNRYQRAENLDEVTESQEKAAELIANAYELDKLSYQFSRLAVWLLKQPFAHGDLKPDNIMVKEDGAIVLVDYDGMYVPAMKGQKARELGSPDFRHPLRTIDDFDEHIDDFPLSSILLSLLAIATRPALFDEFGDDGRLLFTESDYRNLAGSSVLDAIKPLIEDKHLTTYLSLFYLCSAQKSLFKESYHLFYLPEPIKPSFTEDESMSTKVSRDDFVHSWMDVYGYDETGAYNYEEYGLLYSEDKRRLLRCSLQITDCTVREGTKVICDRAFSDKNIVSIQIPESVIAIGEEAFYHCPSLESVFIPEGVTVIGDYAFAECHQLITIHLPQNLNIIGDSVFYGCNKLTKIIIPKGFKSIYDALLPDYKNILIEEEKSEDISTEVTEDDLANAWTDEFGVKYSRDRKRLLKASDSIKEYVINEGTKVICNKAFKGCKNLTSITIPNGVISIGESAFHHRNQLESIVIPNSVISIGRLAFFGCSGLTTLKLSENLRVIGERAFFSCARLSSIRVPSNVEQIGDSAFQGCIGLTSMFVDTQNITYDSRDYCHAIIETQSNTLLCGCRATIIPQGVVKIKDLAFVGIRGLKYIFIPDSVQEIGKCSFAYVSGIESIKVGKNNQYYDSRNNCNAIIETYSNTLLLGCPATLIPESVMRIGSFSFGDESDRAMSINIPEGIKEIDERAFYNCLSLESIIIPDSVEKIGNEAFGRCQHLKEVRLSIGIMEIAKDLFADCIRLEDIEIPISVSKIGISAFYNCSLQEMTIPNGVKNIGDYAFNGCNNLVSIKFLSRIDSIGEGVFQRCNKLANIYIPVGTRQKYENMLPEYREILMEELTIENHKGHRRVFCKKELEVVNRAKVVQGQYTKLVCFYMNDGCQKYIPLCRQSHLSIGDEVDLNTAKLIKLSGEGIYYGYIDGREYYDNNLVDA